MSPSLNRRHSTVSTWLQFCLICMDDECRACCGDLSPIVQKQWSLVYQQSKGTSITDANCRVVLHRLAICAHVGHAASQWRSADVVSEVKKAEQWVEKSIYILDLVGPFWEKGIYFFFFYRFQHNQLNSNFILKIRYFLYLSIKKTHVGLAAFFKNHVII